MTTLGTAHAADGSYRNTILTGIDVVGRVEQTASGNTVLAIGRTPNTTDLYSWEKIGHVVLTPAEREQLIAELVAQRSEEDDVPEQHATPAPYEQVSVPGGRVRVWEPEAACNDQGRMYVMDALGVSVLVRQREDHSLFVAVERDGDTETPEGAAGLPLYVEVDNGGEQPYGAGGDL